MEGDWPDLWFDATYVKVKAREAGRIVSVAVIAAVGVNTEGQREALGPNDPSIVRLVGAMVLEQNDA